MLPRLACRDGWGGKEERRDRVRNCACEACQGTWCGQACRKCRGRGSPFTCASSCRCWKGSCCPSSAWGLRGGAGAWSWSKGREGESVKQWVEPVSGWQGVVVLGHRDRNAEKDQARRHSAGRIQIRNSVRTRGGGLGSSRHLVGLRVIASPRVRKCPSP